MFIWFILACLAFVDVPLGVGDSRYCFKLLFDDTIIMAFKLYSTIIITTLYCSPSFNILKKAQLLLFLKNETKYFCIHIHVHVYMIYLYKNIIFRKEKCESRNILHFFFTPCLLL